MSKGSKNNSSKGKTLRKNAREKEEAALIAQKEKLRANLLRSISHDLRTPLTSISGNASNLLSNEEEFDIETKKQLYEDIYVDSMWLINLVENLLSVTKIEEGRLNIRLQAELLDEVITEALLHINRKKDEHTITYKASEDFILVKVDARMIMQVVINIVDNAIKYTQKESEIVISTKKHKDKVIVCIADNEPEIPDEIKPLVFDMFYSGAKNIADSRRSLGLPDMDGIEVIKKIRTWSSIPIIIISARSEDMDKVEALDAGADDYLTKPFSVEELLARLRVTERRLATGQAEQVYSSVFVNGKLKVDFSAGCAFLEGEELHLTPIEYKLLCLFSKNVGKVLTHTYLTQNIWGHSWENDVASLRVFMATLRKKLEKNTDSAQYIQTHVGVGYRMMKVE